MKTVLQVFTLLIFSLTTLYANEYTDVREISMKKDEQKKILVKYNGKEKLLKLRWTLYKNGGLVIFGSYDRILSQHVHYSRHINKSFRVILKPNSPGFYTPPYLLVKFKEFSHETSEAKLELLLSDGASEINLEYLKND